MEREEETRKRKQASSWFMREKAMCQQEQAGAEDDGEPG
jgi:hypothetical protein